jgi:glyoxylase-like metal-dependent hydrolase (beta-lactamase superfamily II)/8-oxo-dGTP pyrophosphatase MutT (NUDIX family)
VNAITPAASVLLARGPNSREVLVVRRAAALRFFGGFHAFPGGKVDPADAEAVVSGDHGAAPAGAGKVRWVTAARELFEETGLLLARAGDGSVPHPTPDWSDWRRQVIEGRLSFGDLLHHLGLTVRESDFVPLGGVTTPEFALTRFDTFFFLAHLLTHQQPDVWPGELEEGFWTTAADLLRRWTRGQCLVSPPTVSILQAVGDLPLDEARGRLRSLFRSLALGAVPPILFAPEVRLIPLRTQALPPSTHTNAYLIGRDPAYLLDPGATDAGEQERLFAVLEDHRAAGGRLKAVVLTHHHPDHVGAAAACAGRYGVPIWAHPLTARALRTALPLQGEIHGGDHLDLGPAPDGSGLWHLEALHTPGHASGHLAFYEPRYRLLFTGDMVSTQTSVVIAPPDGDLQVYLASLQRLRRLDCRLLLPSHGNVSAAPGRTLDECLAHRAKREGQLLEALGLHPRTVAELVMDLYRGVPDGLMRFAEWQIQAGLKKLQQEGRVEPSGDGADQRWALRRPA